MKNFFALTLIGLMSFSASAASVEKLAARADKAAMVLHESTKLSDRSIPLSLLHRATCVATIPNVIKAGFVFGGRYGEGLVSCRTARGWSAPSYINLAGGSWGLQIGVQSTDLVLVFTRPNAMSKFMKDNFTLGADASVSAGPIGRSAQAGTDYQLSSEIYSYSKSRGLFAGLALEGSTLQIAKKSNAKIYGSHKAASAILTTAGNRAPRAVWSYVQALENMAD